MFQPEFEPTIPRTAGQLLRIMARPYRTRLAVFFVLTLLGIVCWTGSPVIISVIVTRLGHSPTVDSAIWWLVAAYLVLRLADETFWRIAEFLARSFKPQMIERVRTLLFAATLRRPHEYFVNSSSGRISHWINRATETANEFVDTTFWSVWGRVTALIFSTAFLFLVHWSLAVLFAVWLILLFWFNIHRGRRFAQLIAMQSDETSKTAAIVVDSVSNNLSVRVFNSRDRERRRLVRQQQRIITRWRNSWWQNLITNIVKGQSAAFVSALALVMVLLLFANGTVALGGVVLFIAYFGDASSSLWELAWALDNYYRNFGTIQNALDGLQSADERSGRIVKLTDLPPTVELELHAVSFAYPDQPGQDVLEQINLKVAAGRKVGVVGHSGAGKSTLIGLLLGFYPPTTGEITVNDINIADRDPSFIRSISSYVPQDTNLFNRTIRENVAYAKPKASEEELKTALQRAEAWEFVQRLPRGLDTLVGERGVKLSGGQRQRIAIARAMLKDAPLLLLDEATSALDSVSEQAIQRSLHSLMTDRTSIVIAHRLSTLKHLDAIIVVNNGKIVEHGRHDDLITHGGIYADLWQRQKDGFIAD